MTEQEILLEIAESVIPKQTPEQRECFYILGLPITAFSKEQIIDILAWQVQTLTEQRDSHLRMIGAFAKRSGRI